MAKQRSYKRTPEVEKRIFDAIRLGATYKLAAQYGGIDVATLYRWLDKDATFAMRLKEAEGGAVVGWLAKIEKAASDGNWQAAAWKMERRYPEDYSLRQRLEHTGADGGPIQVEQDVTYSLEERQRRILTIVDQARGRSDPAALGARSDLDPAGRSPDEGLADTG
jgi:hypothetical protein